MWTNVNILIMFGSHYLNNKDRDRDIFDFQVNLLLNSKKVKK